MSKEIRENHPEWWRVERFQHLFSSTAEKTGEPEGKALFAEASSRFDALVELTLTGSFGTVAGNPATLEDAVNYAVTPVNEVRTVAGSDKPELFEPWENVLKSFQFSGGSMMKVLREVHDARSYTSVALTDDIEAPVRASFRHKPGV